MPARRNAERPGARLARSYLVVRAEQSADRQPREVSARLQGTVRLPQLAATQLNSPPASIDPHVPPNTLVDGSTGEIDYTRSSWGRSSWGGAPENLVAGWARSSWGCNCAAAADGTAVDETRSSWGSATWLVNWSY